MRVLGIETSTPVVSVAVSEDEEILGEVSLRTREGHMETLLPLIDQLLTSLRMSLEQIDAYAVAIGPGSFTSLRIGMATAKALAQARRYPLAGVPTLDLLAWALKGVPGLICPLLLSRRNEVYTAFYIDETKGKMKRLSNYLALSPEGMLAVLQRELQATVTFTGEGSVNYWKMIEDRLGGKAILAESFNRWPRAGLVAKLGWEKLIAGESSDPAGLRPIYVKQPAIRHS